MADVSDDRFLDRLWYSAKTQAATEEKRVSDGVEARQRRFDESLASIRKAAVATRSALEQRLMKLEGDVKDAPAKLAAKGAAQVSALSTAQEELYANMEALDNDIAEQLSPTAIAQELQQVTAHLNRTGKE